MESLYELVKKLNNLPKGNIYQKKISGKKYFYHQYSEDGVKHSILLDKYEVPTLTEVIKNRKQIEKAIDILLNKANKNIKLSNQCKELTGYLMNEDYPCAIFEKGELIAIDKSKCPIIVNRTKRLEPFLKYRCIDDSRNNSRVLKKILNIKEQDEDISLCTYSLSLTDTYWFKPKNSKLKYSDVKYDNDVMFDTALKGEVAIYPNKLILTPELTTNGSYEKGWRLINNEWWLYKVGNTNELFSELFYSTLFEKLGLPTAHYELDGAYIRTRNFVNKYNFEPMVALADYNDDPIYVFEILNSINHELAKDYLRLFFFDVVLNNIDRHNENCGVLRNKKTGKIVGLAPNFDNNLSLISRGDNLIIGKEEGFLKNFVKMIKNNPLIFTTLKDIEIPNITEEIIDDCLASIPLDVNKEIVKSFVLFRFNYLKSLF